jgi:hypothetical protein
MRPPLAENLAIFDAATINQDELRRSLARLKLASHSFLLLSRFRFA